MWDSVFSHFNRFLADIELRPEEKSDAEGKAERMAKSIAAKYYPNQTFNPAWYLKVGSYGKGVASRPRSDLDMLFVLPDAECERISRIQGNGQSQLLQEIRERVKFTFPNSDVWADGQVVIADFTTYKVEIVPAFRLPNDTFLNVHTGDGGLWRVTAPYADARCIQNADCVSLGKSTHLNKMLRVWKRECNVDIKSVYLEVMVNKFVEQWEYRLQGFVFYDWMVRDFFAFMLNYVNGNVKLAGETNWNPLGDRWASKARTAYDTAASASELEKGNSNYLATDEWRKLFGTHFKGSYPSFRAAGMLGALA